MKDQNLTTRLAAAREELLAEHQCPPTTLRCISRVTDDGRIYTFAMGLKPLCPVKHEEVEPETFDDHLEPYDYER